MGESSPWNMPYDFSINKMIPFMNNKSKPIVFRIGEENKPVINGVDDFRDSLFGEQLEIFLKHIRRKLQMEDQESDLFNDVYENNIIAFIGERGAGKTSCMYSGMKILKDAQEQGRWQQLFADGFVPQKRLEFIKTIDPSFFDTQHNILEMLVGEMYGRLERAFKMDASVMNRDKTRKLVDQFQKTKRHLHFLSSDKALMQDDDELEELAYLSSGVDLRDSVKTLVDCYLDWKNAQMLVIGIDDIDLNTKQAYRMAEQIRKYMILPNVIILMAVKLDQLSSVIRLELTRQFREVMQNGNGSLSDSDVSEMAERYLNKLIPLQTRIFIPDPSSFFSRRLEIVGHDGKTEKSYDMVREAVPALIFAKCRYLFYNTKGATSLIVPRNLRDLRMLIRMLFLMVDYDKNDTTGRSAGNKQQFKRYLFGTWLDDMDIRYKRIANALINETEPAMFNKKVLDLLKAEQVFNAELVNADKDIADILDSNNLTFNISLGDTFYVLRRMDGMETSSQLHKLIFFIKSLYSIRLYEYYDELTDSNRKDSREEKPYRAQELEMISDYQKLTGGNLFLLQGDSLLPKENGAAEREIRNINGDELLKLLANVTDLYNNAADRQALLDDAEFVVKLRVVEFFMLTVSRYIWTSEGNLVESGIHRYRLQAQAYYDRYFDTGTKSMLFDALAPFFTLIDIRHSYERFSKDIYQIACDCNRSLYNLLNDIPAQTDDRTFLSRSCLRNSEIIDDIYAKLSLKRGGYRMSDNADVVKMLYQNVANYFIYTYDQHEAKTDKEGQYYVISFPEFKVLASLFDDENFLQLFGKIFNEVRSAVEKYTEMTYPDIWLLYKSMKGKSVVSRIRNHYPQLYEAIGEDALNELFDSERTYKRNLIIQKIAQAIADNPANFMMVGNQNGKEDNKGPREENELTTQRK